MSTPEENKAIVRRFWEEAVNMKNPDIMEEFDPAFRESAYVAPVMELTREGAKELLLMFLGAFTDLRNTIEDMVAEGDKVVTRYTTSGKHTGTLSGVPATGRAVEYSSITIHRLAGGKI